jgi:hypothetical protein
MISRPIWLIGTLATHARGKVLAEAANAVAVESLPEEHGLCMAFGLDFQDQPEVKQEDWVAWAEPAGRTLLLIPPYRLAECGLPVSWRAYRPQILDPKDGYPLAKLLASEVRFELSGDLQVAVDVGGQWKNGGIHTAYFRKHPHSGVFAMTCLPLWSLTTLDHREVIRNWMELIASISGAPVPAEAPDQAADEFRPRRNHFALMLHLCERDFGNRDEALARLADSPVLAIPDDAASLRLKELEDAGLAIDGRLTEAGVSALLASAYGIYATALRRNRQ